MKDPDTGRMVRAGGQKTVIATFWHDTSRNLDPALHTHSVIANMVLGDDDKWRTMANERLYASKMLLGALYRSELAGELTKLGYGIEKTHADGRFEIAGVSRDIIEAFSTRRAEIEAAMEARGLGSTAENQHLARRAALMTRAHKRDVDKGELRETWARQAADLGFDAPVPDLDPGRALTEAAMERGRDGAEIGRDAVHHPGPNGKSTAGRSAPCSPMRKRIPTRRATRWTGRWRICRSATRYFRRPTCSPPRSPTAPARSRSRRSNGRSKVSSARAACTMRRIGGRRRARHRQDGGGGTRDGRADAGRRRPGQGGDARLDGGCPSAQGSAHRGAEGQAVQADPEREGPHGRRPGLCRHRQDQDAEPRPDARREERVSDDGPRPSASAVQTLAAESGIESETLQRFLARNAGVAEGRLTRKGAKEDARGLRENRAGGRRGLARLHRPGQKICSGSRTSCAFRRWSWSAMRSSWMRSMPENPSPSFSGRACRPPPWTKSCASAIPDLKAAVEASLKGEIGQGLREAWAERRRGEGRQYRRRGRRALA